VADAVSVGSGAEAVIPQFKDSPAIAKLKRQDAKAAKRKAKSAAQRKAKEAKRQAWIKLRMLVHERDKGMCRCCFKPVKFASGDWEQAHPHHVVYRSAGGTDDTANVVTLCMLCHNMEHGHVLEISGNADALLSFVRYKFTDAGREVVRQWEG
jgi:5-methylcytosine-specific restriction endonuclease McrA